MKLLAKWEHESDFLIFCFALRISPSLFTEHQIEEVLGFSEPKNLYPLKPTHSLSPKIPQWVEHMESWNLKTVTDGGKQSHYKWYKIKGVIWTLEQI
jgi:hypothetical protein